jgi:hypothetical protein
LNSVKQPGVNRQTNQVDKTDFTQEIPRKIQQEIHWKWSWYVPSSDGLIGMNPIKKVIPEDMDHQVPVHPQRPYGDVEEKEK